ncbi:hypothetical protein BCR33DRAFT_858415 [Rhizoclosmatium globosum]|uniref:Uncharacterized protein n=1 Tax=Rhizoclosmatium globosum TaxID=329046 RepID=A0A1Y2AZ54_9FUNG|nr:hypothetical protein BCR33DRAFT_858415 [Rhizoclosmatium globosum]|eukprot:ORY27580.1 hypothetical protein BCR33DRAFT_858415 [Rhizoclosmatium globosum]
MILLPAAASTTAYITLATVLIEACCIIPIEAVITVIYFQNSNPFNSVGEDKSIVVYLIIFCLAQLFQIILCWDALFHQNTIQIVGFLFFTLSATAYAGFQDGSIQSNMNIGDAWQANSLMNGIAAGDALYIADPTQKQTMRALLHVVPAIMAICSVFYCYLFYHLYLDFGWKIYKKIGADPTMRYMYQVYQIFVLLLKLDVFFMFGFGIQFLVLIIQPGDPEFSITIAAIPILMAILAFALHGVRSENKSITIAFMCGLILADGYFGFKIYRIYTKPEKYQYTKKYLTFFAALSIIVVTLSLAVTGLCMSHFGKGLKEHIIKDGTASQSSSVNNTGKEKTRQGSQANSAHNDGKLNDVGMA